MASIEAGYSANAVSNIISLLALIQSGGGTVMAVPGHESTTAEFRSATTDAAIVLKGQGFTYSNGALTSGTVTGFGIANGSGIPNDFSDFAGLSAAEVMSLLNGAHSIFYNLVRTTAWIYTGRDGDEDFFSGELDDVINAAGGNDIIYGNGGDDKIDGGTGTDTMYGGAGNDTFYVSHNSDRVRENAGEGKDTVISANTFTLHASAEIENLRTIDSAGTGSFALTGNNFSQNITGNSGHNRLIGLGGNDGLSGGNGNDRLYGGSGNDTMRGGNGADVFVFNTTLNSSTNKDTILDFSVTADTIWLDNATFTALGADGGLSSAAFRIGTAAADASDRVIYNSSTGALIYDSNGSASGGAVQFAKLATGLALTSADFFII